MAVQRIPYRLEEFQGENNRDSPANQRYFSRRGAQGRHLARLRGYHLIGYGRALSRRGYRPFEALTLQGTDPIQGLRMYEFRDVRHLVGVGGGKIKTTQGSGWTDRTGSVAVATGQNNIIRFCYFTEGTQEYILGTDGTNPIWRWAPGGNATILEGVSIPTYAKDIATFHGYFFVLGVPESPVRLEHGDYGTLNFSGDNIIECTQDSAGVALTRHSEDVLLAFFERELHRVIFNPADGPDFYTKAVDMSPDEACISRSSVSSAGGYTYWASPKGPMRWRSGKPEYIGGPIQDYWEALRGSRRNAVTTVVRGAPWTEILWLVSDGSDTHNALLCWNTRLEGWSIFPKSATTGKLSFNCGCNWRASDLTEHTILGGYGGYVYEAFGSTNSDSGYDDDGAQIETEMRTGYLTYDYEGVTAVRDLIVDFEVTDEKTFNVLFDTGGNRPQRSRTMKVGKRIATIDEGFMVDVDYVQDANLTSAKVKADVAGRLMQTTIHRMNNDSPHVITGLNFSHVHQGMRMY